MRRACSTCRFWSERVARSIGCGPMEALCLRDTSPHAGRYVKENDTCNEWKEATHGAVDDPSDGTHRYPDDDYRPVTVRP